ncbi:MAG: sigma-54-dependent Fis family transcriptional regulator [Nitrospirae bacterium]|nr:sigma-54-dependent Fis family transcriptional regulator [Nitrospirota bacterium]
MSKIKTHNDDPANPSHLLPVLLVDDEQHILLSYSIILRTAGIENIITVRDSLKVMPLLSKQDFCAVVLDLTMPHKSGDELLAEINYEFPNIPVIIMTAIDEVKKAVECIKSGAVDYLVKPVEENKFVTAVKKAMKLRDLRHDPEALISGDLEGRPGHASAFSSTLTKNRKMFSIFRYIEAIAGSLKPVLITGETGVGKELISKAIHELSGTKGPLVPVNTAGLDDTMFSDALFGHKKGAFTGADRDRKGLIVKASGGTLFLDEIGDLSEQSQVKLLRLLEEHLFYPLGSDVSEYSDARIIASTNRDLKKRIYEEKFREDLFFRLNVYHVHVPPLRERYEDIPLLLDHFLEDAAKTLKKKRPSYPAELITFLSNYSFPGNVREIKAMCYHAMAHHKKGILPIDIFRSFIKEQGLFSRSRFLPLPQDIDTIFKTKSKLPTIKEAEEFLISEAMKRANGNQGIAASFLGLTRHALNKRLTRQSRSR